jgi:hypothetical protein
MMNDIDLRERFDEWAAPLRATPPPKLAVIRSRARRRVVRIAGAVGAAFAVTAAVTGLVVSNVQPTVTAAATRAPQPGDRAEALALGNRVLDAITLPMGSRRYDGLPLPAPLRGLTFSFTGTVDPYVAYRLPVAMPKAARYLEAHLPANLGNGATGQTSRIHGPTTMMTVTSDLQQPPAGIAQVQLYENVVPGPHGTSLLLAEALVTWYPPRSAAEQLTAARFAAIRITQDPAHLPVTTNARDFMDAAVGILDRLPAMPGGPPHFCPTVETTYQLVLVPAQPSQPDVVVHVDGCEADTVTVGGRPQPTLQDIGDAVYRLTAAFLRGNHR